MKMSSQILQVMFLVILNLAVGAEIRRGERHLVPSFLWIEDTRQSDARIPYLNIRFPDKKWDDFVVITQSTPLSIDNSDCIMEGHLYHERNVTVKITKGCPLSKSFEINFDSSRLLLTSFRVTDGKVNPILKNPPSQHAPNIQASSNMGPHSLLKDFPVQGFLLSLKAFYDQSFKERFDVASEFLITKIVEKTQDIFFLPSLKTNITLNLVEFEEIPTEMNANNNFLNQVGKNYTLNASINAFIFFTDYHYDENSTYDTEGIAFTETICSSNSSERVAIVEWTNNLLKTSRLLAHEIGHLIGMNHDFHITSTKDMYTRKDGNSNTCSSINAVMDYSSERSVWSTCSVQDFLVYYNSVTKQSQNQHFCLNKDPPVKRYTKVAVALGGDFGALDSIEVINLSSSNSRCQNLKNFPYKNYDAVGSLGFGDNPIICGGYNQKSSCHSLQNGSWKPDAYLKEERWMSAMTKSPFPNDGSKLFVTGGWDDPRSSEVLTENGWQLSTPLPEEISSHFMVMINSTSVMVIGGKKGKSGETSGRTFLLDGVTKFWREGPELKQKRGSHSCAMIRKDSQSQDKSVIVVGGRDDHWNSLSSTEVFDVGSSEWKSGPELPFGIYYAAMVEDPSGGVVLIGGFGSGGKNYEGRNLDTLFRLPHAGSDATWEEMSQKLKTARRQHTAFLIPDELANCN